MLALGGGRKRKFAGNAFRFVDGIWRSKNSNGIGQMCFLLPAFHWLDRWSYSLKHGRTVHFRLKGIRDKARSKIPYWQKAKNHFVDGRLTFNYLHRNRRVFGWSLSPLLAIATVRSTAEGLMVDPECFITTNSLVRSPALANGDAKGMKFMHISNIEWEISFRHSTLFVGRRLIQWRLNGRPTNEPSSNRLTPNGYVDTQPGRKR